MAVVVTGSRSASDSPERQAFVTTTLLRAIPRGEIVIVGDARGVDALAREVLEGRNPIVPFEAKWKEHGGCRCKDTSPGSTCKFAGYRRNLVMLDQRPERVVAIWDYRSSGTRHTIESAEKRGIPVERYRLP